jgi:hypothetical protein
MKLISTECAVNISWIAKAGKYLLLIIGSVQQNPIPIPGIPGTGIA